MYNYQPIEHESKRSFKHTRSDLYLNPEPNGPINPTQADFAMGKFRQLFPYRRVYVLENKMLYGAGSLQLAQQIIRENNLPLFAIQNKGEKGLTVKYIPAISACYYLMNINTAA